MKSIMEIIEQQDHFWNNDLKVFFSILVPTMLFSLLAFALIMSEAFDREKNNNRFSRKGKRIILLISLFSVGLLATGIFAVNSASDRGYELRVQESELTYEFYQSIDKTETVETNDIINSFTVNDSFCSHVKLKENENCTFVEFVSETPISKVFIPLESERFSNSALPISITYLSFTKEERDFANKLHNFSQYIRLQQYEIKDANWSFGVSINK